MLNFSFKKDFAKIVPRFVKSYYDFTETMLKFVKMDLPRFYLVKLCLNLLRLIMQRFNIDSPRFYKDYAKIC